MRKQKITAIYMLVILFISLFGNKNISFAVKNVPTDYSEVFQETEPIRIKSNILKKQSYLGEESFFYTENGVTTTNIVYHSSNEQEEEINMDDMEYLDARAVEGRFRYNQLSEDKKALYKFFKKYFDIFNSCTYDAFSIDERKDIFLMVRFQPYTYAPEDINKVLFAIRTDYPEYYWYATMGYYPQEKDGVEYVRGIELYCKTPFSDKTYRNSVQVEVNEGISKYINAIDGSQDTNELELDIHDMICKNFEYSLVNGEPDSSIEAHSIVGAFTTGKVVCEGYARAFQLLLYRFNVYNNYVCGDTAGGYHAWNQVYVDRHWVNVDITWDDADGFWDYRYYNKNDESFLESHIPNTKLYTHIPCSSKKDYARKLSVKNVDLGCLEIKYKKNEIDYYGKLELTIKYKTKMPLRGYVLSVKNGQETEKYSLTDHESEYIVLDYVTEKPQFSIYKTGKNYSTEIEKTKIKKGEKTKMFAFSKAKKTTVRYYSQNPKIASVSKDGVVQGKKKGSTYICCKINRQIIKKKVQIVNSKK